VALKVEGGRGKPRPFRRPKRKGRNESQPTNDHRPRGARAAACAADAPVEAPGVEARPAATVGDRPVGSRRAAPKCGNSPRANDAVLTGGDVDASGGGDAPGTKHLAANPTPDQDVVDDIGKALGVEYQDNEELRASDKVTERDKHRWELDPASSEDYRNRK
jgi:hypothetical protein